MITEHEYLVQNGFDCIGNIFELKYHFGSDEILRIHYLGDDMYYIGEEVYDDGEKYNFGYIMDHLKIGRASCRERV